MLLLPFQLLSGDPAIEPPISSGVFRSGGSFQAVLQDAQQQLVVTADPGLPDESPPQSLALVVAEALTEALASDAGVTNRPNQVAQGEVPKLAVSPDVPPGEQEVIILQSEFVPVSTDESKTPPPLLEADVDTEIPISNFSKQPVDQNLPMEPQGKPVVAHRPVYNALATPQQEQQVLNESAMPIEHQPLPSPPMVSSAPQMVKPPPEGRSELTYQKQEDAPIPLMGERQEIPMPLTSESVQVQEQNSIPVVRSEVFSDEDTGVWQADERPVVRPVPVAQTEPDTGEKVGARPAPNVINTPNVVMPDFYAPAATVRPLVDTSPVSEEAVGTVLPSAQAPVYDGSPITGVEPLPDSGENISLGAETTVVTEMPVSGNQAPEVAPHVPGSESLISTLGLGQEMPVVEPAMPDTENRAGSPVITEQETTIPVMNREASVVDGGVQAGGAPVVTDRPVESDGESVRVVNREAVVADRPVVMDGGVQAGGAPVVSERQIMQSGQQLADFAPQQAKEQPVISQIQPQEGIVSDSLPVVNRSENRPAIGQMPSARVASDFSSTVGQANAPVVSQNDQKAVIPDTTAVLTGSASAFSAEVERPQVFSTSTGTGNLTVDGSGVQVASTTQSFGGNMSESHDEQTPQRTFAPVEQGSVEHAEQESFVMQQANAIQAPEQPVQVAGPGTSELDVEIGRLEGLPTRVDMTASRTAQETAPEVDLEASAEQIERTYRVSEQIIRSARVLNQDGATQVTLRLDPPELGEVTIRLSTGQDRAVSGEIVVENQKVQEIVQRNMGVLRETLSEQGIQINQIDVSVNDRAGLSDRESFRETLEERSDNSRSGRDQERPQTSQEIPEEISQALRPEGGVNFMA